MIQAWLVLPGLYLAYLFAAPLPQLSRRFGHVVVSALVALVVSLSWMTIVTLVPAHDRPYADGSCNNSVYSQVFLYNGFDRATGDALDQPGCTPPPAAGLRPEAATSRPRRRARDRGHRDQRRGHRAAEPRCLQPRHRLAGAPRPGGARRHPRGPATGTPHRPLARRHRAVGSLALPDCGLFRRVPDVPPVLPGRPRPADGGAVRHGVRARLAPPRAVAGGGDRHDGDRHRRRRLRHFARAGRRRSPAVDHRHRASLWRSAPWPASSSRSGRSGVAWELQWGLALSAVALLSGAAWASGTAVAAELGPFDSAYQPASLTAASQAGWARDVAGWPALVAGAKPYPADQSINTQETSAEASIVVMVTGREFLAVGGFTRTASRPPRCRNSWRTCASAASSASWSASGRTRNPDMLWVLAHCQRADGTARHGPDQQRRAAPVPLRARPTPTPAPDGPTDVRRRGSGGWRWPSRWTRSPCPRSRRRRWSGSSRTPSCASR